MLLVVARDEISEKGSATGMAHVNMLEQWLWTKLKEDFLGKRRVQQDEALFMNDGESVNRLQIDIRRKTCDIQIWKRHSFLDISSINMSHRFTNASKPAA
jgi:hypothetical protein